MANQALVQLGNGVITESGFLKMFPFECKISFFKCKNSFRCFHKVRSILPPAYFNILKSYVSDRTFQTKANEDKSDYQPINPGVPQDSVLGPLVHILYTSDLSVAQNTV